MTQIAEGSESAFRQLFDAYRKKIYTYLYRVTGSAEIAEDTVQDIFLKIWSIRTSLPEIENINAYLHRMAHNHAYTGFRKLARESLVLAELRNEQDVDLRHPGRLLLSKEVRGYIQNIIDRLSPQQRMVFLLSREEGLKQEEIARRMNISLASVKKHMVTALRSLRTEIEQSYGTQAVALYVVFQLGLDQANF